MGLLIFSHKLLEGNELFQGNIHAHLHQSDNDNCTNIIGYATLYGAKLTSCQRLITERSHMPDLISSLLQHSPF